jgi:hypothetical protein
MAPATTSWEGAVVIPGPGAREERSLQNFLSAPLGRISFQVQLPSDWPSQPQGLLGQCKK